MLFYYCDTLSPLPQLTRDRVICWIFERGEAPLVIKVLRMDMWVEIIMFIDFSFETYSVPKTDSFSQPLSPRSCPLTRVHQPPRLLGEGGAAKQCAFIPTRRRVDWLQVLQGAPRDAGLWTCDTDYMRRTTSLVSGCRGGTPLGAISSAYASRLSQQQQAREQQQ
jgi:hypothetical protein